MALGRSELSLLSSKYRLLSELRRRDTESAPPELKRLSRDFPGALRELDALPLAEIDRRRNLADGALEGEPVASVLEWIHAYHSLMRAALSAKRHLHRIGPLTTETLAPIVAAVAADTRQPVDFAFLQKVEERSEGRLNSVVFAELARTFATEVGEIRRALFHGDRVLRAS